MRKTASKSHWHGKSVLAALALAVGSLALLFPYGSAKADAPPFQVTYSIHVISAEPGGNGDLLHLFDVGDSPWPTAMYENQITYNPSEWGIADGDDVDIGAVVGKLISDTTLGWFNNPCSAAYGGSTHIEFDPLLNCSKDTSQTVTFDEQFDDDDANDILDGCDKYPDFLNTMFDPDGAGGEDPLVPRARYAGFEYIAGNWVSVNFAMFEPGTEIPMPGMPASQPDLGYLAVSVVNDPTGPLVANQITDFCPPLGTDTYDYGLTLDNPDTTGTDESGDAWRTNPASAGTYTFTGFASSLRDADNDDYDNGIDTCPHVTNLGDARVRYSGDPDDDGLDSACDPTPDSADADPDSDTFPNRQDNCPLVANASQADGDYDDIGDACDQDDWNNDGDTTDPGEPTGFSSTTPDGDYAEEWITSDATINAPVGGLAELPEVSDSSSHNYIALAGLAAAALIALSAGAWYTRKRWLS